MEDKSMRAKVVLTVFIVFLAGFLAGIGSAALFMAGNTAGPFFLKKEPHPRNPARAIERMTRELVLDPQQEAAIARILERAKADIHELRTSARPRVQEVQERTKQEIMALLNDEQKRQFGKAYAEFQKHAERRKYAFDRDMMPPRPEHAGRNGPRDADRRERSYSQ